MKPVKTYQALIVITALVMLIGTELMGVTKEELDNKYSAAWAEYQEYANTAKMYSIFNQDEIDFIYYINLARLNPTLFAETYLKDDDGPANYAGTASFIECKKSLSDYLKTLEPRTDVIYPDNSMCKGVCDIFLRKIEQNIVIL